MQQIYIKDLLKKYKDGTCTPAELEVLENWYLQWKPENGMQEPGKLEMIKDEVWQSLAQQMNQSKVSRLWPRIGAAAAIIFALSFGSYSLWHKTHLQSITQNQHRDVPPGSNRATLTLANGQKIILTKGLNGRLANLGNTLVQVNAGNAISYTTNNPSPADVKTEYNILTTKKGEQSPYPLILADGSKVWLNAASSITFPTTFNGEYRVVTLTGEAYFEVSHNQAMPFRVKSEKQTVEVLGTHFDINTYAEEPSVKTTLLEGSVRIQAYPESTIIKPGQQAVLSRGKLQTITADTEDAMAWKNGLFSFTDASLESIMREVERWYNVEIVYGNDEIKQLLCSGIVTRFSNVSTVLRMMERTRQVHFKIEGKKIIVMAGESSPDLNN